MLCLVFGVACSSGGALRGESVPATTVAPATTTTTTTTTVPVPADVQALIASTTMTDRGRRAFLGAGPEIEDTATFARNCGADRPTESSDVAVVHTQGCYVNARIHLLATDRPEARTLLSIVAAHELLHAVYASLAPADRNRIDGELMASRAGNDRLEERLRPYGKGPTLTNEIHSILGSEFDGLSPGLEAHYAQFFADRAQVVAARRRTFGEREDDIHRRKVEVADLDTRISTLKDAQAGLRSGGDIRSYNANVAVINGLIARYNAAVAELNGRIAEYNELLGG